LTDIISIIESLPQNCSDLHISVGSSPACRINGRLMPLELPAVTEEQAERYAAQLLSEQQMKTLKKIGEADSSVTVKRNINCRVNVYKQRNMLSIAIRMLSSEIPSFEQLNLPPVMKELCMLNRGLVLITGPTGSGKTTTLSAMINWINQNRSMHIITIEDPIEYLHQSCKCIVDQRAIGQDCISFNSALRSALRQDPDVILIGEMRDLESISIALSAAETGHLVLSSLHTLSAAKTIDRIIDVFPPYQQQQVRIQLASALQAVICQQLVPLKTQNGRIAATEVMLPNPAIRNLIRENKLHQITNSIITGSKFNMRTMDASLIELYNENLISYDDALAYCSDLQEIKTHLKKQL